MSRRSRLLDLDPRTLAWILIVCAAVVIVAFHPAVRRRGSLRTVSRAPQPARGDLPVVTERAGAPSIPAAPTSDAAAEAGPPALALPPPLLDDDPVDDARTLQLELARWPDLEPVAQHATSVSSGAWRTVATTDDRGRVSFELPGEPELRAVQVAVPGFQPRNLFLSDTDRDGRKSLPLRPARGFSGRVLDLEGNPVSGVDVIGWYVETPRPQFGARPTSADQATHLRLLPQRAWSGHATRTTWKGTYYLPEPDVDFAGELTVVCILPDASTNVARVGLPRAERELPALQMRPPRVVRGSIVDAQARPLERASVHAALADGASIDLPGTTTDALGRFELILPQGEVLLHAVRVGYHMRPGRLQRTAVRAPRRVAGRLEARAGPELTAGWHEEKPYVRVQGDEVPPLVLDPLPPRQVFVYESGVPGTESRHELGGVEIRVRYPDAAETEFVTETGLDGVAIVPTAPRGLQPVRLSLARRGYDYLRPLDRRVGYSTWYQDRGEPAHEVRLARVPAADDPPETVRVGGVVSGLVRGERAEVRVYSAGTGAPGLLGSIEIGVLESDERGVFLGELPWVVRGGAVRVVASAGSGDATRFASSALIELDELADQELRLRLEPAARVVLRPVFPDAPGSPAPEGPWTVVVRASSSPAFSDLWSRTLAVADPAAPLPVFHLPIGASLVARAVPHGDEVVARVSDPEEVLELLLPAQVTLAGRVEGVEATAVLVGLEDADQRHAAYGRPAADGSFRFERCPPGVYDVFLYARVDPGEPLERRSRVEILCVARVTANASREDLVLAPER